MEFLSTKSLANQSPTKAMPQVKNLFFVVVFLQFVELPAASKLKQDTPKIYVDQTVSVYKISYGNV